MERNVRGRVAALVVLAALLCCQAAGAASESRGNAAAVIIYADGSSFSVVDARGIAVRTDPVDPVGMELVTGDTLVTESDTFLELQLVPSANVIKVAENTNFTIEQRGSARGGTFNLVYGKVRARVQSLSSADSFTIRSQSATAGVRGTDFGVSVELTRTEQEETEGPAEAAAEPEQGEAVTEIYCFQGEVVVVPSAPEESASAEPAVPVVEVVVRANEMVSIAPEAEPVALQTQALSEEVKSYWEENDFQAVPVADAVALAAMGEPSGAAEGEGAATEPVAAAEPGASVPATPAEEPVAAAPVPESTPKEVASREPVLTREQLVVQTTQRRVRFRAIGVALFVAGALLGTAGAVDYFVPSVDILGDNGIGFMGMGAVFLIGGSASALQVRQDTLRLEALESGSP